MKSIFATNRQENAIKDLEVLLRSLSAELPEGCASVLKMSQTDCAVLDMNPSNPHAAQIRIIIPVDVSRGVTLIAGKGSFFEIPFEGRRYTALPFLEEVQSICRAVIAGTLEESVLLDHDEVIQGTGSIKLPQASAVTTVKWGQIYFRPFRKKTKKEFRYEPYTTPAG